MAEATVKTRGSEELQGIAHDSTVISEVSEEFSLPDYIPEVRRILGVKAGVLPESRYIQSEGDGARLDLSGTVTYSVLYTSEDGELYALPISSSYEGKGILPISPEAVITLPSVEGVTVRVNAPRRLSIRSRVKNRAICVDKRVISEKIENRSAADEMYIQRDEIRAPVLSIAPFSAQGIKLSGKIKCDSAAQRPVWCDGTMVIKEASARQNGIKISGEVIISCLCSDSAGHVTLTKSIPFTEEIERDGISPSDKIRVSGKISSLSVSKNDSDGEIFLDADCEIEGEAASNREAVLTKDMYSTKNELTCEYKREKIYSLVKTESDSFKINESVKRKNNDIDELITVICDPVYEKTEIKGQRAIVNMKLSVRAVGKTKASEDRMSEYVSDTFEIPVKYGVDLPKEVISPDFICDITLGKAEGRYDNDKFYISAEAYPSIMILDSSELEIVSRGVLNKDTEYKSDSSCVRVYYPKKNESLFDIAKKYHTTVAKLTQQDGTVMIY